MEQTLQFGAFDALVEYQLEFVVLEGVFREEVLLAGVPLLGWGEKRVEAESEIEGGVLEGVFDDGRNEPGQERTGQFKAGVGVDFDEAGLIVLVDHEVHPQQLKIILSSFLVQRQVGRSDCILRELLHLRQNPVIEHILVASSLDLLIKVALELLVADLISLLILAVLF